MPAKGRERKESSERDTTAVLNCGREEIVTSKQEKEGPHRVARCGLIVPSCCRNLFFCSSVKRLVANEGPRPPRASRTACKTKKPVGCRTRAGRSSTRSATHEIPSTSTGTSDLLRLAPQGDPQPTTHPPPSRADVWNRSLRESSASHLHEIHPMHAPSNHPNKPIHLLPNPPQMPPKRTTACAAGAYRASLLQAATRQLVSTPEHK